MVKLHWTQIEVQPDPVKGLPCPRSSHGLSALAEAQRLILFGGEHVARTPVDNDQTCWMLEFSPNQATWQWIDASPVTPRRIAHAQAVHENNVYLFGGRAGVGMDEQALNDLWVLDCKNIDDDTSSFKWMPVTVSGSVVPPARSFHRMICIGDALYVFGGCGAAGRLNDLWRFDINTKEWKELDSSSLKGRGGPNLLPLASGTKLGVVAGFCGQESADGQVYDLATNTWDKELLQLESKMRPRSVCVCGSFPSVGVSVVFGGEVDPSDRGHEGAGGFCNNLVLLQESDGAVLETVEPTDGWPGPRGWADAAVLDRSIGMGHLFVFGGLAGDDANPVRLGDLWKLDIQQDPV